MNNQYRANYNTDEYTFENLLRSEYEIIVEKKGAEPKKETVEILYSGSKEISLTLNEDANSNIQKFLEDYLTDALKAAKENKDVSVLAKYYDSKNTKFAETFKNDYLAVNKSFEEKSGYIYNNPSFDSLTFVSTFDGDAIVVKATIKYGLTRISASTNVKTEGTRSCTSVYVLNEKDGKYIITDGKNLVPLARY